MSIILMELVRYYVFFLVCYFFAKKSAQLLTVIGGPNVIPPPPVVSHSVEYLSTQLKSESENTSQKPLIKKPTKDQSAM